MKTTLAAVVLLMAMSFGVASAVQFADITFDVGAGTLSSTLSATTQLLGILEH